MRLKFSRFKSILLPCGIIGFTTALFFRTIAFEFLNLDDLRHIPQNPWLVQFDVAHFWRSTYFYLYAPVAYTTWAVLYQISSAAWIFHLANVLLHAANAGLVYLLARRLRLGLKAAFVAAIFFAVHPAQLEAVAWISAGRDQISAFFGLLAVYAYLAEGTTLFLTPILFILGALAKPSLVALPLAQIFLADKRANRARAFVLGAEAVAATGIIVATRIAQAPITGGRMAALSLMDRLAIVVDTLGFYARRPLVFWESPIDYARTPAYVLENKLYLLGIATLATVGYLAYRKPWMRKEIAFGAILLLPVSGLLPFLGQIQSTVADRYLYLPMVGLALLVARAGEEFGRRKSACFGAGLALLAYMTWTLEPRWKDDRSVFSAVVREQPRSYLGRVNLANVEVFAGNYDRGLNLLREARSLNTSLATAFAGLAQVYWIVGKRSELLNEIGPRLRNQIFLAQNAESTLDLSVMYLNVGRAELAEGLPNQATEDLCAYARLDPAGAVNHPEVRAVRSFCPR